jgi:hypothetical protein
MADLKYTKSKDTSLPSAAAIRLYTMTAVAQSASDNSQPAPVLSRSSAVSPQRRPSSILRRPNLGLCLSNSGPNPLSYSSRPPTTPPA